MRQLVQPSVPEAKAQSLIENVCLVVMVFLLVQAFVPQRRSK